jgi:hypothetical protein
MILGRGGRAHLTALDCPFCLYYVCMPVTSQAVDSCSCFGWSQYYVSALVGENICFEVMESTVDWLRSGPGQRVFRARFSAISESDILHAMVSQK